MLTIFPSPSSYSDLTVNESILNITTNVSCKVQGNNN